MGDVCEPITDSIDTQKYPNEVFAEYSMPAFDASMKPDIVLGSSMNSVRKIITRPCLLVNKLNVRKKRIWYVKKPNKNAVCSAEFIPLHSDTVDLTFLNQVAKSETFTRYLENHSSGSSNSQKRITPRSLMLSKLHIPTIEEQKLIGKIFESLDRTITLHEEKKCLLERLKSALLQKMFADESGYPVVRFEGFSDEWVQRKLGDVVGEIQSGNRLPKASLTNGDVPYVVAQTKNDGVFQKIARGTLDYNGNPMKLFPGNSISFSIDNPEAMFYRNAEFYTSNIMRVIHEDHLTHEQYVFILENMKRFIRGYDWSRKFSGPVVSNLKYLQPSEEEQQKIGSFFKQLDDTIALHQQKINNINSVKKSLLQKMFI